MTFPKLAILFSVVFLFSFLQTRFLIPILRKKRMGQTILDIGPAWHKSKEGTPTMGGIVFLMVIPPFALLGEFFLIGEISKKTIFLLLFALSNGLIGMLDDGTKLKKSQNLGLLPWQKLVLQSVFTGGFLYLFLRFSQGNTLLSLPFTEIVFPWGLPLLFFAFLFLLGGINCVNLSDGIDGLTTASSFVIGLFFVSEGIRKEQSALLALGIVLCGCMLGFFLFNRHPAKIFMGDTGSLFLGALLSGAAFLTQNPTVLVFYAVLFFLEGASVILQVTVFKRTGKRILRMAPWHHHLEKCGWSERRIVFVFSFITLLGCLFAHFALLS